MVQVWQYNIRYYKKSSRGRKQYYKVTSPFFGDRNMCYSEMVEQCSKCSVSDYVLESFWIDAIFVEDFEIVNAIMPF